MNPTLSPADRLQVTAATLFTMAALAFGLAYALNGREKPPAEPFEPPSAALEKIQEPPPEYFPGQPTPALVLMLNGQTYGYLQPCGCSRPQIGGLERRLELLKALRSKGWPVIATDLGDLAPKAIDEQGRIKFETALQILHELPTAAVGMGFTEMTMPWTRPWPTR